MATTQTKNARTLRRATKDQSQRLAVVPDRSVLRQYIGRKFGPHTEFDVMQFCLETKTNLLIEGPTGPGKTMASMAFAAKNKMPFYATPSNVGIEPSQLFGKYLPTLDGGFVWQDGPVTDLVRHGGLLLINEVNFIPERVATVLFSLLDKRREIVLLDHRGETIKAHEDLLIIADMNPNYEGTRPLNKAFRNRFGVQLFWDYDPAVEKKLVKSDALRALAVQIRDSMERGIFRTPLSTNMLMEFEKIAFAFGYEFAVGNFVSHFANDERDAVRNVFQTLRDNIEPEMDDQRRDREDKDEWQEGDWVKDYGAYGTHWNLDDNADEEEDEDSEDDETEYADEEETASA